MKFSTFCFVLAAFVISVSAEVPNITCYFSASIRSSIRYSDGTVQNAAYEHYSIAKHAFMQSGLVADWFPRNMTSIFVNPYNFTYIQPFFKRKICAKIPYKSIVPCFLIDHKAVKRPGTVRCPTDLSSQCEVYESDSETWHIRYGTKPAIPDQLVVRDSSLGIVATSSFIKFDPHRPDESKFVVPADQPCSNLVNRPVTMDNEPPREQRPIDMVDPFQLIARRRDELAEKQRRFIQRQEFEANNKDLTNEIKNIPVVRALSKPWVRGDPIPDEFDAAAQWPNCNMDVIQAQGACSSSWAISAAQTFADRYCIASKKNMSFSPQYLIDCSTMQLGCRAGFADQAFMDLLRFGIVPESCWPYRANASTCPVKCVDGSIPQVYRNRDYGSPYKAFDIARTEEAIQEAILSGGPVTVEMWLFGDFNKYTGGVYEHDSSTGVVYQHTMRMVGWGVDKESGKKYWRIANTYGTKWGEKGYIRVLRGVDECGLESMVALGNPAR